MYSRDHLLVSLAVGAALAWALASPDDLLVVGLSAAVGVGIDVDHFLVARLHAGTWRAAREFARRPWTVFTAPDEIFEPGELWPLQRLLSHVVLGGVLVLALAAVRPTLALVAAVSLYAHLLADLVEDNRNHRSYLETAAAHADETGPE
ncbi:MAG: hypothetical protein ABEJ04_00805 [Halobacteriaceae archaeon]